jgi:aerobic-type carbon monoxide dehydrogenase small subunit (CoxS/CutS family)
MGLAVRLASDNATMNTIKKTNRRSRRAMMLAALIAIITVASPRLQADVGNCGGVVVTVPFTDVSSSIFFCSIAGAYFAGLTMRGSEGGIYLLERTTPALTLFATAT